MSGAVYRIPAGVDFAHTLAAGLLARYADNPLGLSDVLILLPTRRACRTLQQAFLRQSEGKALLLPRLLPLGDLDADELLLTAGVSIAPAVSPRQRQLILSRLIAQQQPNLPTAQYLALAKALARLFDDSALEGASLDRLGGLVDGELAGHWQTTLNFISPLRTRWQDELNRLGLIDAAERRNLLLHAQAKAWREAPPNHPVLIAGSTGALPAIATLMQVVKDLPHGELVLPALPSASECQDWWDQTDTTHPLCELKSLLATLAIPLDEIKLWPGVQDTSGSRTALLHHALRPAQTSEAWAIPQNFDSHGLMRLDCATEQEEASTIALVLRQALTQLGRTAMLVTPDRNLGRRVAGLMQRWSIQVDDSAGTPLAKTESAVFLRLLLGHAAAPLNPSALLALLKHPMFTAGRAMGQARRQAQRIELEALRQRPPVRELNAIKIKVPELADWIADIQAALAPLFALFAQPKVELLGALKILITSAETLASTDAEPGSIRLWRGDYGQKLSDWLSELLTSAAELEPLAPQEIETVLLTLMSDSVVRPRYGEHPRLFILGPVEARLQQADWTILAGLNEGVWPAPPEPDPWLSRPMRKALGLKSPEARLGQEAHDFYSLASAPWVLLTRALRQDGTPTVPARWLSRLDTVLQGHFARPPEVNWQALARSLDVPEQVVPTTPPAPTPPRTARPKELYVTQIETWLQDPYALYAKKILRLKKLDPLDDDIGTAERGTFYHAVLHQFIKDNPRTLPANARTQLLELGEKVLQAQGLLSQRALWWPRFERLIDWFLDHEAHWREQAFPLGTEVEGHYTLPGGFTVKAKADRIDRKHGGGLAIIDYKTGTLPAAKRQEIGLSVQLPLEGAIAQYGEFKDIPKGEVDELTFWRLSGGNPPGEVKPFRAKTPAGESITDALDQLAALVAEFDNDHMSYHAEPYADHPPRFSDYRHLARWKEWALLGEEES